MPDEDIHLQDSVEDAEQYDPKEFAKEYDVLKDRCANSKISLEEEEIPLEYRDPHELAKYVVMHFPCGRQTRRISLFDVGQIRGMLALAFERYVFLGEYNAICSYQDGVIEAAIRSLDLRTPRLLYRRLFGRQVEEDKEIDSKGPVIELQGFNDSHITIGPASEALKTLVRLPHVSGPSSVAALALRIENVRISQHDQAVKLLERITDSLFFQIDLVFDTPLTLIRQRRPTRRGVTRLSAAQGPALEFPKTEYDQAPMSLYWYARSATGMPLLQYLAFYQAIEFYFSVYSEAQARRVARQLLKDPSFRIDRDADIGRILSLVRGAGQGIGDERSQLRATLQECLDATALREFLEMDEKRSKFFSSKTEGLTNVKLQIANPTADLRNDVAERIYDIRCKIVHTKSGGREGEVELLLPFSPEAELLYLDIELIQFVARQVLIAASSPFHTEPF